jgi:hypothetical protein
LHALSLEVTSEFGRPVRGAPHDPADQAKIRPSDRP